MKAAAAKCIGRKRVQECDQIFKLALIVLILLVTTSFSVFGEALNVPCRFLTGPKYANCLAIFNKVPNKQALTYALSFMEHNTGRLADARCVRNQGASGRGSTVAVRNGIQNRCQFVINDMSSRVPGFPFRAHAYLVDLCSGDVRSYMVNKGTGGYGDIEGAHTTSAGAYLTSTSIRPFTPKRWTEKYTQLQHLMGGTIPALDLGGVHSTNNDTAPGKPMHVSPYQSSHGCPSVSAGDAVVLRILANHGPSLILNYVNESMNPMASVTKCDAAGDRQPAHAPHWLGH